MTGDPVDGETAVLPVEFGVEVQNVIIHEVVFVGLDLLLPCMQHLTGCR